MCILMANLSNYICVQDGALFSRYSNAKRHNLNIHQNNATIVATTDYLLGVSQGRYRPPVDLLAMNRNRRRSAKRMPNFNYIIPGLPPEPLLMNRVARDSVGDRDTNSFRPGVLQGQGQYNSYLQQHRDQIRSQSSVRQHQPSLPSQAQSALQYPTAAATTTDQSQSQPHKTGWGIMSEDTIAKIVELKRLLNRHPTTFPNPEIIIQGAKHFTMMGDISFLDEKIAYLKSVDAITPPPPPPSQQHQQQTGQDNFVV
jgi:hypothetical protein